MNTVRFLTTAAVLLIIPPATWLSAGGVALLMLGVVVMRVSMGDRVTAIAPAFILFVVNAYLLWRSLAPA